MLWSRLKYVLFLLLKTIHMMPKSYTKTIVVFVDPKNINRRIENKSFVQLRGRNLFREKPWVDEPFQKHTVPFDIEKKEKYISLKMRIFDKAAWKNTPYYENYAQDLANKKSNRTIKSLKKLNNRYQNLDRVIESIQETGCLSTEERHLITVHIDEHGEYSYGPGGSHRLCLARLLNIDQIPVKLGLVHKNAQPHVDKLLATSPHAS